MDPPTSTDLISITSQLFEHTAEIAKYVNNVRDAPVERSEVTKKCVGILDQLNDLRSRAERTDQNHPRFNAVRELACSGGTFDRFKESLETLAKALKSAKPAEKDGSMILWPLSKQETENAISDMQLLQNRIVDAIPVVPRVVMKKVDPRFLGEIAKERGRILRWISTTTFASTQQDYLRRRQEGTGKWFLDEPLFQGWLLGQPGILWCSGMPGSGKTTLASVIIDHLKSEAEPKDSRVLFLYCSNKEQDQQTALGLVRSLVRQIVESKSTISPEVGSFYKNFILKNTTSQDIEDWSNILSAEVGSLNHIYIVIDAFDECSKVTQAGLLQELRKIVKSPRVKLLVTARPMEQVEIDPARTKTLEIYANQGDMRLYLEAEIDREERLSQIIRPDQTLRGQIVDAIISKANGMFLTAKLHLSSIASKHNLFEVRNSLDTLAEDLDGVYDEAMFSIQQQDKDDVQLAENVLVWVACAKMPLRTIELREALAVKPDKGSLDLAATPDATSMVNICAGLVTIDERNDVIRLLHSTTQDYFDRYLSTRFPRAQSYLASTCLNYLLMVGSQLRSLPNPARDANFPFFLYATACWSTHLRNAETSGSLDKSLAEKVARLLTNFPSLLIDRHGRSMQDWRLLAREPDAPIPLHFAITQDLPSLARTLIQNKTNIDSLDSHGRSALQLAVRQGNQSIILALLQADSLVLRADSFGRTVLYDAICQVSTAVVQLLLGDAVDSGTKSALWHLTAKNAMKDENLRAIKVLVDLISPDITTERLFNEFLSALVARDQPGKWGPGGVLEHLSHSANVCRADTTVFAPHLFAWETESSDTSVLFARVADSLIIFSSRLIENLDKSAMLELAEASVLVLPENSNHSAAVGLALSSGCEPRTDQKSDPTSLIDLNRLLETDPFSSMLNGQQRPFSLLHRLSDYPDEIWRTSFSHSGTKLAIAGRKGGIVIYETETYTLTQRLDQTPHERGLLSGAVIGFSWSPDDRKILAMYSAGVACIWDLETSSTVVVFDKLNFNPTCGDWDPSRVSTLIIGTQDGPYGLRCWTESGFDLRFTGAFSSREIKNKVHDPNRWTDSTSDTRYWQEYYSARDLKVSGLGDLLVAVTENVIHVYRAESKRKIGDLIIDGAKIMSVDIARDARHILVSNGGANSCLILVDAWSCEVVKTFHGPAQTQFNIRGVFGGLNDEYVISGSEDGRVYIWDREARLLAILQHSPGKSVNDVSWHPKDPTVFASVGDDGIVCIWKTSLEMETRLRLRS